MVVTLDQPPLEPIVFWHSRGGTYLYFDFDLSILGHNLSNIHPHLILGFHPTSGSLNDNHHIGFLGIHLFIVQSL